MLTIDQYDAGVREMTRDEAESLTRRIRIAIDGTWELIRDAYLGRVWLPLGYESWDAYTDAEFGSARLRLPREERREAVASLRDSGLSIRAIAAGLGVNKETVVNDVKVYGTRTPEPAPLDPPMVVDEATGEVFDEEESYTIATDDAKPVVIAEVRRSTVTGLDGKTYQAPAPSKPRQKPLTDTAFSAVVDLTRVTDRLQAVVADPRFTRNADQISATNLSDLIRARDAINQAISALQ